jgi:glucose/arabinose dehydrogenase
MRPVIAVILVLIPTAVAAQLRTELVAGGLRNPVGVAADPTDPAVLFVVEQNGFVRVVRDGRPAADPFLDLRSEISTGGERGLLGLAFSPDAESGRVFVNFTNRAGDTVVARFRRSAANAFVADARSRFDLLWPNGRRYIEQPFSNHNGGHLAFGPDGYLYIGMGDGGNGGDPFHNAQDPNTLLGKMLRIDVSVGEDDPRGYRIPEDNPFVDGQAVRALHEIWAFGLRNPWKYSFDAVTGGLTIADVGQNEREEINFEPAGAGGRNYGWRLREGRRTYDTRRPPAFTPLTEPIHDYDHNVGSSITGGFIYRGAALDASYNGRYFYADFIEGRVFSIGLHLDALGEATADDEQEHTAALGGPSVLGMISAFGLDAAGELLVLNWTTGTVLRIVADRER